MLPLDISGHNSMHNFQIAFSGNAYAYAGTRLWEYLLENVSQQMLPLDICGYNSMHNFQIAFTGHAYAYALINTFHHGNISDEIVSQNVLGLDVLEGDFLTRHALFRKVVLMISMCSYRMYKIEVFSSLIALVSHLLNACCLHGDQS